MNLKIISAGAGSGKTYRLTQEMVLLLRSGAVRASGIIATTFTKKAAAELQERVRVKLLEEGMTDKANELANALIGTVHGLGVKLLRRFSFEAGVSPEVDIIADEDQQAFFNLSLSAILTEEMAEEMDVLAQRLGLDQQQGFDWRKDLKTLCDAARSNAFSYDTLEHSRVRSFESLKDFLGAPVATDGKALNAQLLSVLQTTIDVVAANGDDTKKTQGILDQLKGFHLELSRNGRLAWHQWAKIMKMQPGKKSVEDMEALVAFAATHDTHPDFHNDIQNFIDALFNIGVSALKEYESYKKRRGLIDYTDMESCISQLLEDQSVQEVLKSELDLLMVDEFQDTSPLQLDIFYKLSRLSKHSIWVGDPKQSIYGFRGAEPRLMQAIIDAVGGVRPEDIQECSWRSRKDLVFATNALFCRAFPDLACRSFQKVMTDGSVKTIDQVSLVPARANDETNRDEFRAERLEYENTAIIHWHFMQEGGSSRVFGRPWLENCIAKSLVDLLQRCNKYVLPKDGGPMRLVRPGDIAILCRKNDNCVEMAKALHRQGIKAAIARDGLLQTAEIRLTLAALKLVLFKNDALAIAEIKRLASNDAIESIIDDRLLYLQQTKSDEWAAWGSDDHYVSAINDLRPKLAEHSSAEILDILLDTLDIRRVAAAWGNVEQRFENIDALRRLAHQYESQCERLHSAASLGGFILWLHELEEEKKDAQGSGESWDAVNVLTYHKSKGLEYPLVICHDLEATLRNPIWGFSIESTISTVDLDNILANRWLRYWPNPYSKQEQGTRLVEAIKSSDAFAESTKSVREEEARLLYVGITRARDYLVLPTRQVPSRWLNRVWNEGNEDQTTLEVGSSETPWEWEGRRVPKQFELVHATKDFEVVEILPEASTFFAPSAGMNLAYPTYKVDVGKEWQQYAVQIKKKTNYAGELPLESEDVDWQTLLHAYRSYLDGDNLYDSLQNRLDNAENILLRFKLSDAVAAKSIVRHASLFFNELQKLVQPTNTIKKFPIRLKTPEGRLFETLLDMVIETKSGVIVVQHSQYLVKEKKMAAKTKEMAAWWHFTKTFLQEYYTTKHVELAYHYPLQATWILIA